MKGLLERLEALYPDRSFTEEQLAEQIKGMPDEKGAAGATSSASRKTVGQRPLKMIKFKHKNQEESDKTGTLVR